MFLKTSLNRLRGRTLLDPRAVTTEQLFLAPPFTEEVVAAIRLISTRLPLKADEASRLILQQESNAACAAEWEALAPLAAALPRPARVLEIGPGFGRSVVYFEKKGWTAESEIHLYDADGTSTQYKQKYYEHPPKWPDTASFCGNLSLLQEMLRYNGITRQLVHDARQMPLVALPGPYDLLYGFYSIGFHWSLEYYLEDLEPLLHATSVLVCTLNKSFRPFARLANYHTRVLRCREVKRNAAPLRLLALSKSALPAVGESLAEAFPG